MQVAAFPPQEAAGNKKERVSLCGYPLIFCGRAYKPGPVPQTGIPGGTP